jgi:plastocyanin
VRWVNGGVAPHTATARDGSFDSGFLSTGDGFSRTFNAPGTIEYFCTIHPAMTGTVIVTGAGGRQPPGSAAPSASPSGASPPQGISPPPNEPGVADIALLDFRVDPLTVTVPSGARVRFVNRGAALHTATFPGGWDTGFLEPGQAATLTFDLPGTYAYLCVIHPTMIGTLVVTAAAAPSPAAAGASPAQGRPGPGAGGGSGPPPAGDPNAAAPPGFEPAVPSTGGGPLAPLVGVILIIASVGSFGWVIRGAVLPGG